MSKWYNVVMEYYSVKQAAELLHVSPLTVRRWNRRGYIEAIRVGPRKDRRFSRQEIDRILEGK